MASKSKHILSFGCGVNTTALMILLVAKEMPFDEAVFADTGAELPETYAYLDVAKKFLRKHGRNIVVVRSKTGTLYETCVKRSVVPSKLWRWSTRDYKVTPIHAYYRELGVHIYEYLGIGYDEIERMKPSVEPYITSLFPLVDLRISREACVRIIEKAGLPVPVKSGCYFCPFNNIARWEQVHDMHPELYRKAMKLEEGSKHFPKQTLTPGTLRGLRERGFRPKGKSRANEDPCGAYCMT